MIVPHVRHFNCFGLQDPLLIKTETQLESYLSEPTDAVIASMTALAGGYPHPRRWWKDGTNARQTGETRH